MNSRELGAFGEKIAVNYLKKQGYKILDRNYSFRIPGSPKKGELDIIARKADIISFIEVKTLMINSREQFSDILPEDKVNFQKQRKLVKTAQSWLQKSKIHLDVKWQTDVMAIKIDLNSKKAKIRYLKNAVC